MGRAFRGLWPGGTRVAVVVLADVDGARAEETWRQFEAAVQASEDLRLTAQLGGSAAALSAFAAATRGIQRSEDARASLPCPAFAISVGEAVKRGLPTAARATITGRAPLRSGLVEAPFGGQFARAFAQSTDVLLVLGEDPGRRAVIHVGQDGEIAIAAAPFDAKVDTQARARALTSSGKRHALLVGPAGEAGVPFANLGSWSASEAGEQSLAPSLVGRGGLGATVASAGVVAVTVSAAVPAAREPEGGLARALEASPRLISRAKGGTLELGDVRSSDRTEHGIALPDLGEGAATAGQRMRPKKHGCEGCPTPCGWQFDLPESVGDDGADAVAPRGEAVGGRFAALQGFLVDGDMESAMAALQVCNLLGLDARTAVLVLGSSSEGPGAATPESPADRVRRILEPGSRLGHVARGLRPGSDVEPASALMPGDLAARVGVAFAARGPEPLRSLSVFGHSVSGHSAFGPEPTDAGGQEVPAPWARDLRVAGLTGDAEFDAGVIAHWHECYSAALDVTGFCAFSASALLADGVLTLDQLSERVPFSTRGRDWLSAGAAVVALHREHNALGEGPEALRHRAQQKQSLPAAAVRGYYESMHRGTRSATSVYVPPAPVPRAPGNTASHAAAHPNTFAYVLVSGSLATRLASFPGSTEDVGRASSQRFLRLSVPVPLPGDSARGILERIVEHVPRAKDWLFRADGGPLPAILIAGRAVSLEHQVWPGDEVELLLVIPGG